MPRDAALPAVPEAAAPLAAARYGFASFDRAFNANLARLTFGLSPAALAEQAFDWAAHLALSPGKCAELAEAALRMQAHLAAYALRSAGGGEVAPLVEPARHDWRFRNQAWQHFPYNLLQQGFLLTQQWWQHATTGVDGVSRRHEHGLSFTVRQMLDMVSPSNFVFTNPEVAQATYEQGGRNLVRGFQNFLEDWTRATSRQPPVGAEKYLPGRDVAVTPGKVIYQDGLIELIQYQAATPSVFAQPVLIVPAWIMKYYILDLSPANSLVRYLVEHGHTVFMVSWKNPISTDRDLALDDYRRAVLHALDAVTAVVPGQKVHGVGYCLGGTLLLIAAAAMARDGDMRLGSLTLLAAQSDFTEPGEITLFTDESEVAFLEDMMWDRGYLDTYQMAGAFQILRSNDLIWSRYVHEYLLGGRQRINDLMAWNADATRMPYRMHSEYLHHLLLNNELATGSYQVDGHPVALSDIRVPSFTVGTVRDHVAPWPSVFKTHLALSSSCGAGEATFLLTSGGHNAGIISAPGPAGRSYQIAARGPGDASIDAANWQRTTNLQEGSWWPAWQTWLAGHSSAPFAPPAMGAADKGFAPRGDAPGTYVHQS